MKARKNRPLLLIDIAVPRDIEPQVNFLENVYLYNIDDLQAIADDYLRQRREEIARCEAIIAENAAAILSRAGAPASKNAAASRRWARRAHEGPAGHSRHPRQRARPAQTDMVLAQCREKVAGLDFEIKIIKTTGDKLQTASMSQPADAARPKDLFTKELEAALLKRRADLAVHSLKDLPTELPEGLKLGAVGGKREDARDVIIYKDSAAAVRGPGGIAARV